MPINPYALQEELSDFIKDDIHRAFDKLVVDTINQLNAVPTVPATVAQPRDFEVFTRSERDHIIAMKHRVITDMRERLNFMSMTFYQASMPEGLILAGGCFSSLFYNQAIKDYDVFVLKDKNFNTTRHAIDKFILDNEFSTASPRFRIGNSAYINNQNNQNKIIKTIFDTQTKVQFIITEFTSREELIDHFDCEHACVSVDLHTERLYISRATYDCIANKLIRRHKDNTILDWRKQKFKTLGWKVS